MPPAQRIFACVEIPAAEQQRIAAEQAQLPAGLRLVKPEIMHITLHFLGDVSEDMMQHVLAVGGRCASSQSTFTVSIGGLGAFPNIKNPRVIWASVFGGNEELARLSQRLAVELSAEADAANHEAVTPHVTIARALPKRSRGERAALVAFLAQLQPSGRTAEFDVSHLTIMRSELGREGPSHSPVARLPFGTDKSRRETAPTP